LPPLSGSPDNATLPRLAILLLMFLTAASVQASPTARIGHVVIDLTGGPTARFDPREAFGAGVDGLPGGEVGRLFTPHNIAWMKQAGLAPITYRLRTELAIDAWHWGPEGNWSDPAHNQGYWTSSDNPSAPILSSWGYRLPRRGDTIDQADDHGYSRLDDGDTASFWKSNPYLDRRYSGEDRPQWVVVCLDAPASVDAARIRWASPWAAAYDVQYWVGADEYDDEGRWVTFPGGAVRDGRGGAVLLRLAPAPVRAKFLRILLLRSSGAAAPGASDPRDAMGYAIGEVSFGMARADGTLADVVRHAPDRHGQSVIYVSSTDPWHRAIDRDPQVEQPGFDRLFASGLTNGLPVMIPVGALYDTPENAAAEIRFLRRRGYPIARVELGEEPDGQNVSAVDFAALFSQFAAAVHGVDPAIQTGGPSLQDGISDIWLDSSPDRSWTRHFVGALVVRGRLSDLGFFSFERYPIDDLCGAVDTKLRQQTANLATIMARLRDDRVPTRVPWFITEYGISAFGGQAEVEMPAALVNADIAAQFVSLGGAGADLFGYGPNLPFHHGAACSGNGELMLLEAGEDGRARWALPTFWGAQLLTQDWAGAGEGVDSVFPVLSDVRDRQRRQVVAAYALARSDGRLSVLLINRDAASAHVVRLSLKGGGAPAGAASVVQYGSAQYAWRADGLNGHPLRSDPPRRFGLAGAASELALPPYSLTVITTTQPQISLTSPRSALTNSDLRAGIAGTIALKP
jgi:hypothetical protein